jgi:hypothetical protein
MPLLQILIVSRLRVEQIGRKTRSPRLMVLRTKSRPSKLHFILPTPRGHDIAVAVIVWTEKGHVTEQRDGGSPTSRTFNIGQIDLYPGGTTHSFHAAKGSALRWSNCASRTRLTQNFWTYFKPNSPSYFRTIP